MDSDMDVILNLTKQLRKMTDTRRKMEKTPICAAYIEGYNDGVKAIQDAIVELQKVVCK